ncbi:DNA polymerase [Ochrobactrum sp. BTU1]|uniref:DNA polymerase n=1 Tax=Ochrobactrum sp. BTU1 TaxID=2840456 RepID=UPI001C03C5A0|nr:hypothetical protein KMS41_05040 [Ochrobactrum sp. BTU1]
MSRTLIFDLESNGLLEETTTIHSLVIKERETGEIWSLHNQHDTGAGPNVADGLRLLEDADFIVGHNIQSFDIPVIQKLYPWFKPKGIVRDTLIMSRFIYAEMLRSDIEFHESRTKKGKKWIEKRMWGRHSLEAWGQRLGVWKGDYGQKREEEGKALGLKGPQLTAYVWGTWSQEMQDYCVQDVEVTEKILDKLEGKGNSEESINLEHDVRRIVTRQENYGFGFNERKAAELYGTLSQRKAELERDLQKAFKPWYRKGDRMCPTTDRQIKRPDLGIEVVVKKYSKVTGREVKPYIGPIFDQYIKDSPYTKVTLQPFNATSRFDIADRLKVIYGWKPKEFTKDGHPKIDEEVLSKLKYPVIPQLLEYLMIQKRIGQVAEGKESWLKHCKNGRIHGRVNTAGAVTGRMTHSTPNIAQAPSGRAPYGHECRELFVAGPGKKLVGCDADALELRDLAGYMAAYDGGAYIKTVLEGKKEDGTDMHTLNAAALGCSRDDAKTWFYAFIYGAGDFKLGMILAAKGSAAAIKRAGAESRAKFLNSLPALKKLTERVKTKAAATGTLKGLDGRILKVRSGHAALNTLLQSAGAIQMKRALVILDNDLQAAGLVPGVQYEFVANVHDEWQIEVDEDKAEFVGKTAAAAIAKAGEYYSFRCKLAGNYDIGSNWAETH